MTRIPQVALSALIACLLLAGCSGSDDDGGPTSSSPSATSTGSTSPGVATSIEVTRAPTSAEAGGNATVCWRVFGTGKVPHTAIHWDDESHAAEPDRTFQDYSLGVSYPGNQSMAHPAGYQLNVAGADFCTSATLPSSGSIFVVAHVIDSTRAPGRLSTEREIRVGSASDATIHIQNFAYSPNPLTVPPGATVAAMNMDAQTHTVTASGGAFDTQDIQGGGSDSFTAPMAPGTYTYGCAYHAAMQGVLEVVA